MKNADFYVPLLSLKFIFNSNLLCLTSLLFRFVILSNYYDIYTYIIRLICKVIIVHFLYLCSISYRLSCFKSGFSFYKKRIFSHHHHVQSKQNTHIHIQFSEKSFFHSLKHSLEFIKTELTYA